MKNFPLMTTLTFVVIITSLQLLPVKAAAVSVVELPEIIGQVTSDLTGTAVATGDINGDGYDDLLTTTLGYRSNSGGVYLVYGGEELITDSSFADAIAFTGLSGDYIGNTVSTGDINGDGYDDILIGASNYTNQSDVITGAVFIVYGQADPLTSLTLSNGTATLLYGRYAEDYFGAQLASADLNNDSADDLIVGASGYGSSYEGAAYIIYGTLGAPLASDTMDGDNIVLTGLNVEDYLGDAIASIGDLDQDGFEDVVIGVPGGGNNDAGHSYVLYGRSAAFTSSAINSIGVRFTGAAENDYTYIVAAGGDINGDGYDDMLIGGPSVDSNSLEDSGAVYFVPGQSSKYTNATLGTMAHYTGEAVDDNLGLAVASGDLDGDGYSDILMSTTNSPGKVYFDYGSDTFISRTVAGLQDFVGEEANDQMGRTMATGDLNNDGYDEVIFGSKGRLSLTGSVYVLYSIVDTDGDGIAGTDGVLEDGVDTNDNDFDNDGIEDTEDTVINLAYEINSDGVDNDGDGEIDENNTLAENGVHTNYESLDPDDEETATTTITSVQGRKNGKIKVTYSDDSVYMYRIFSADSTRKTKVKQFDSLGYIVAVQANSKKIALLNAYTGEVYNRKTINQNARRHVGVLQADVRNDDQKEIVVTNRKGEAAQVVLFTVSTTNQRLKKRSSLRLTDGRIATNKTRKKVNKLLVRNNNSRVLYRLNTNSSYKLTLAE